MTGERFIEFDPPSLALQEKSEHDLPAEQFLVETGEMITTLESREQELFVEAGTSGELRDQIQNATNKFKEVLQKYSFVVLTAFLQTGAMHTENMTNDSFTEREKAKIELLEEGATRSQRQNYIPGVSEFLSKAVSPYGYNRGDTNMILTSIGRRFGNIIPNLIRGGGPELGMDPDHPSYQRYVRENQNRMDAWRLYLGLPQEQQTFGISDFQPTIHTQEKYYFKINNFLDQFQPSFSSAENGESEKPIQLLLKEIAAVEEINKDRTQEEHKMTFRDAGINIMGAFKLSRGQDEKGHYISYYDKWNLEGSLEGEDGIMGKPFEIYDRIYYNPETFEVTTP